MDTSKGAQPQFAVFIIFLSFGVCCPAPVTRSANQLLTTDTTLLALQVKTSPESEKTCRTKKNHDAGASLLLLFCSCVCERCASLLTVLLFCRDNAWFFIDPGVTSHKREQASRDSLFYYSFLICLGRIADHNGGQSPVSNARSQSSHPLAGNARCKSSKILGHRRDRERLAAGWCFVHACAH